VRDDLERIEAALTGTPLAGLPVGHGPAGTILVADIEPDGLHEAWQAAEALVPITGRRPIMVTDDFTTTVTLRPAPEPGLAESELREFAEAAASSDPWLTYRSYAEDDEVEEGQAEYYVRGAARLDLLPLVSDVPLPAARPTLERVLYDRLLADPDRHARVLASVRVVAQKGY
jgi:hypothetical protein